MDFPNSKNIIKDLVPTHPDFDLEAITKAQDFYEGGKAFRKNKAKYLLKRALDKDTNYKANRLECAKYTRELGKNTDSLVGCILRDLPRIVVNNPNDARAEYWKNLNTDIDGYGHSIEWLLQSRLVQTMLHDRSYLTMDWPSTPAAESKILADDKTKPKGYSRARLDIRICYQNAENVDDWEVDDDGRLTMIRAHTSRAIRGADGAWDTTRHTWTFITDEVIAVYSADCKRQQYQTTGQWKSTDTATRKAFKEHGLAYMPIEQIPAPEGMSFGDAAIDTYDALWNTRAAKAFLISCTALNTPWVKGITTKGQLKLSEQGFLNLGEQGEFGWSAPPQQAFVALRDECADLKSEADSVAQALGDQALQTHQSGVAVGITKGPKEVFLTLFRNPTKTALQTIINRIAVARKEEDLEPRIIGMDQLGEQAAQLEVVTGKMLLVMPITTVAKKSIVRQIVSTNCDLSEEENEEFEKELEKMKEEDFNPPVPTDGAAQSKGFHEARLPGKAPLSDATVAAKTTTGEPMPKAK